MSQGQLCQHHWLPKRCFVSLTYGDYLQKMKQIMLIYKA